jgi:hypothetical protein
MWSTEHDGNGKSENQEKKKEDILISIFIFDT